MTFVHHQSLDGRRLCVYDDAMPSTTLAARVVVALLVLASCGGGQDASGPDTLIVAPATAALIVGDTLQVTATLQKDGAELASGTVTWSSSDPDRAMVEERGSRATIIAVAPGTATITASGSGLTATIDVAISAATLTQIAISPATSSVPAGTTTAVTVIATYSNATTADVAPQATWVSAQPSIASVTGNVLAGFQQGETMITATHMGQTSSMRVTVIDPLLQSIDVAPANSSVLIGRTQQFTATGFFTDASTRDITRLVTWESSALAVATISNAAGTQGRATALAEGPTTISASTGRATAMTILTVEPLSLQPEADATDPPANR